MRSLIICTAHPILSDKIEMGGACSAYGGGKGRVQSFGGEASGKETAGKTQV